MSQIGMGVGAGLHISCIILEIGQCLMKNSSFLEKFVLAVFWIGWLQPLTLDATHLDAMKSSLYDEKKKNNDKVTTTAELSKIRSCQKEGHIFRNSFVNIGNKTRTCIKSLSCIIITMNVHVLKWSCVF